MSIADPAPSLPPAPDAISVEGAPAARPGRLSGRTFDALSNRDFRYIYFANVAQFGSMQMKQLVQGVLVYEFTGSFAALGLVSLAHAIPGLVLSPVGGVVADRVPKRSVMQWGQTFNMNAAVLGLLAGTGVLGFPHIIVSAVLQGFVNAIMMPSRQSIIPDLVGREKTMNAVALNTSGENVMQLVGPALGGFLLAVWSPSAAFALMACFFAVAVYCTSRVPKYPPHAAPVRAANRGGNLGDLREGFVYTISEPTIRTLIGVNFLVILASMPYTALLPGFVHDVLHRGAAEQGFLMSVTGVGAVVGSLFVASLPNRNRGQMLMLAATVLSASLVAFAVSEDYYITLPIMLIVGVSSSVRRSLGQVLIQTYPDPEYRGRVMAIWMMQFSLMSLGTFGAGILS
ncbi:MAG: MFS transporter, partial [Dehalococcoidia bacterium]